MKTATEELIARWVEPNPHKPGPAEAWVLPGYVSIWALIVQLQLDGWKAELVAEDHELPLEAVQAAVAYYRRNQAAIDAAIAHKRAVFSA